MLRMSEDQYADHQARVKALTPMQIKRELEKAVRWTSDPNPAISGPGRVAVEQIGNLLSMSSINKHEAIVIAGAHYDSKAEYRRHNILLMREAAGFISDVMHHPERVEVIVNGVKIATFKPDFQYFEQHAGAWRKVWEDVKGFTSRKKVKGGKTVYQVNPAYRAFKFKAKLLRALFPDVEIRVVTSDKIAI